MLHSSTPILAIAPPRLTVAIASRLLLCGILLSSAGCSLLPGREAEAQPTRSGGREDSAIAVEAIRVQTGSLEEELEYTGTTEPFQRVSLRSQVEGQLLGLSVDVGDAVEQGQVLARLDDNILLTDVNQAQAELAARQSEVAQARAQVSEAQTLVEQARAELQQAQADADRLQQLAEEGAIAQQQAELAQTTLRTTAQALRSAEEQVRSREQAVIATQGRVTAQQAVVAQTQARQDFTALSSPINGVVLDRVTEPGNLVQPGAEVLALGDFSSVKVRVQISERELSQVRLGQGVRVRLDAFPDQEMMGEVTQISPAADPTARLVPVEVTIPNRGRQIGSGLLARVRFTTDGPSIVVPQGALEVGEDESTLFIVQEQESSESEPTVTARPVQVGNQSNGRVEILAGVEPGDAIVIRSSRSLSDGSPVRLSVLSDL